MAATVTVPPTASSRRRATWSPSRGEPIDSTVATQGPVPAAASGGAGAVPGPATTRSPIAISPRPTTVRCRAGPGRLAQAIDPNVRAVAPRDTASHPEPPTVTSAAPLAIPIASHALRGMAVRPGVTSRANRHQRPDLVQRCRTDHLSSRQLID